ncbi:MAG TPA: tRNA pseudouridine(38-40) synthase TruA [Firmicutes bacterium]|jgi:tRNA pseudouridine38-40 synthase|nr:tRNA pseudouridine(38-40) synthase TruA [Bacillota bacterium]
MATYKLVISYDGTAYHGFQYQENAYTVQEALEKAIHKLYGEMIRVGAAGRTDAGVHARGQVVSFRAPETIPGERLGQALRGVLPRDIVVVEAGRVDDGFLSRKDAKGKVYTYTIDNGPHKDVFMRNYSWHLPRRLDLEKMQKTAILFLGEHDFKSFQAAGSPVKTTVRTISSLTVTKKNRFVVLRFEGNGFLYKMVRRITGTLARVGLGKREPGEVLLALRDGERRFAGPTAPPGGLCLEKVLY